MLSVICSCQLVHSLIQGRDIQATRDSSLPCHLLLCSYEASLRQSDSDGQVAQLLKKMESQVRARVAAEAAEASAKREVRPAPATACGPWMQALVRCGGSS